MPGYDSTRETNQEAADGTQGGQRDADHALLGAQAAAHYLGVHRSTLHLAIRQGALAPDGRTPGGHVRFRRATLDTYRQRLGEAAATGEAALSGPMRAVRELTGVLLAGAAPEEMAQRTVEELRRALAGLDTCVVAAVAPRSGDPLALRLLASYGMPDHVLDEFRRTHRTFRFACTTVLRTLDAEVCEDTSRGHLHTGTRRVARFWPVGAYAILPVVADEQPLGFVVCASQRPRRFNAAERTFLQTVADLLALSLRSAVAREEE